jgi:formylglycine-generating enzyme required for sulfatase activity
MGSNAGKDDERPPHPVTVPPFFLAKYELTRSQLARLTGKHSADDGLQPAGNRSFYDARQVAAALGLRLPTEAEWEYAVRAGTTSKYWWGEKDRATTDFRPSAPVGSFPPNPFGLHDMAGEIEEWVEDCYHSTYTGAPTDGSAWVSGDCEERVVRGGRVRRFTNVSKSSASRDSSDHFWHFYGFRLARTLP